MWPFVSSSTEHNVSRVYPCCNMCVYFSLYGDMISRCVARPYCYESCHQLMDTWIVSTFRLE